MGCNGNGKLVCIKKNTLVCLKWEPFKNPLFHVQNAPVYAFEDLLVRSGWRRSTKSSMGQLYRSEIATDGEEFLVYHTVMVFARCVIDWDWFYILYGPFDQVSRCSKYTIYLERR